MHINDVIFVCTLLGGFMSGVMVGMEILTYILNKHGYTWNQIRGKNKRS